jgi:hypothetical protein
MALSTHFLLPSSCADITLENRRSKRLALSELRDFHPISTVGQPPTMESGGPVQVAISPMRAAGWPPTRTVALPGGRIGPPTWGTGGVPGVTIGQVCMSPTRAAGWPQINTWG